VKWGGGSEERKKGKERKVELRYFGILPSQTAGGFHHSTAQDITAQHILIRHSTAQHSKIEYAILRFI
jgi:hypothetical protein